MLTNPPSTTGVVVSEMNVWGPVANEHPAGAVKWTSNVQVALGASGLSEQVSLAIDQPSPASMNLNSKLPVEPLPLFVTVKLFEAVLPGVTSPRSRPP